MAIYTRPAGDKVLKVEWLHWLFIRGNQALSCDVDVRDGAYAVSVLPCWKPADAQTELFCQPGDAFRRHAEIATQLRQTGWLLAERGPVSAAAR